MLVVDSVSSEDNQYCVDFFKRDDGTFGFEEYRRDIEDYNQWFKIGCFDTLLFTTKKDAVETAVKYVIWLKVQLE